MAKATWKAVRLTNVQASNPAFRDEFFALVAMVFPVKDEESAIALANESDFGLGGSAFTKNLARGKRVASLDATPLGEVQQRPLWLRRLIEDSLYILMLLLALACVTFRLVGYWFRLAPVFRAICVVAG